MINRVVLVGRMTRDPELKRTPSGAAVVSFTIAVDNRVKGANGEKTASFIPCVVWNQAAENVARFTHKGSLLGVDGRLSQRTYDSKDNRRVQVIEVVCDSVQFLERKSEDSSISNVEESGYQPDTSFKEDVPTNKNVESINLADDDLPF